MHQEPITPGPRAPRHWVPLFLAQLAVRPDLEAAYRAGGTTEAKVNALRQRSGYFDAAYRIILREHRRRAHAAGQPAPPIPGPTTFPATHTAASTRHAAARQSAPSPGPSLATAGDLARFVGNGHATAAIFRADLDTLSLLCTRLAEAVGLDEIEGKPVAAWFMAERRATLERNLLAIGDTDPALYEHLQRHLGPLRKEAGPASIVSPPEA